ncbi:MAG: asparagine synthase-related protein [Chloroflexota bacterium]|nr:asparagine synthase-related protein [Chloroflexota bacterium]
MSGILAVLNLDGRPITEGTLDASIARIAYRGREHQDTWTAPDGTVMMSASLQAVTRTDRREAQPVTLEGVTLIADALLLARPDLIAALRQAGRSVTPDVPNSVLILHAYLTWGVDCLSRLTGEFALIAWDARARTLFAAHDPMRVRELFYAALPDTLIVSNELMAIMKHPSVSGALDEGAVGDFLMFGLVDRHDKSVTFFRDARRLLPAHWLRANTDSQKITFQRYWDFPMDAPMRRSAKPEDDVAAFRALFRQVIRERVEDIDRVTVLMSGGLDSTSVAAMITSLIQAGEVAAQVSAVSMVYDRIVPDTEAPFAKSAARFLDMPIELFTADDYAMTAPPPARIDPLQDFTGPLIFDLERALVERGTLAFSGNGGDEILTVTPLYKVLLRHSLPEAAALFLWLWRFTGKRPRFDGFGTYARELLRFGRRAAAEVPSYGYPTWFNPEFERRAGLPARFQVPWSYTLDGMHRTQPEVPLYVRLGKWANRTEFSFPKPYTALYLTMPFVDVRLVHFAMTMPPAPWNRRKLMLRQAMEGMLPPDVLKRPKTAAPLSLIPQMALPGVAWIDTWQPMPEFEQYVRREAIPPVFGTESLERAGIDTRPLFFNEWLRAMRAELGK